MSNATKHAVRKILLILCVLLSGQTTANAAGGATITFQRIFKGSSPEHIEIKVSEQGPCSFDIRQESEEQSPRSFQVGSAVRAKIFELAQQLQNFRGADLD